MATGVSGSMSTYTSTYIVAAVDYSETYDVASNASSVTASLWYKRTNSYNYATTSPGTFYVNINGTNYSVYSGTFTIPANDNNWHKVGEKTVTGIAHNSDGTKSITVGGSHSTTATNVAYLNFSMSKNIALTTIPRASVPTVSTGSLVMGNSLQIATNRKSSSFTHRITAACGGHSVTYTNVGASVQFVAASSEWMPYMTAKEQTVTVTCTTYNGSTQIGSAQQCSFTLKVDESVYKPVIGTPALSDDNSTTAALENAGTFILNASKLKIDSLVIGVNNSDYGTQLASAKVTCGDQSHTFTLSGTSQTVSYTFTNFLTSGTLTIEATDNRGVKVTKTVTLTTIAYQAIKFKSVKAVRTNDQGDESETGDKITYTIKVNMYRGSFGQSNNAVTLKYRYKTTGDYSSWITLKTVTPSSTASYAEYAFDPDRPAEVFSSAQQFDIQFYVEDALTTATASAVRVLPGIPVFAWGENYFDVFGSLHVHDRSDITKFLTLTADSLIPTVETQSVSFSGADGGSVTWTILKIGNYRIAVCAWRSANNYAIDSTWAGMYYSNNVYTPNFPFTFSSVLYQSVRYVAADAASHAEAWDSGHQGALSTTNAGYVYLVRPNDGGPVTVGHPRFVELVIGTVA